jgi:hypothetical protein
MMTKKEMQKTVKELEADIAETDAKINQTMAFFHKQHKGAKGLVATQKLRSYMWALTGAKAAIQMQL